MPNTMSLTNDDMNILASLVHGSRIQCQLELEGKTAAGKPTQDRARFLVAVIDTCNKISQMHELVSASTMHAPQSKLLRA